MLTIRIMDMLGDDILPLCILGIDNVGHDWDDKEGQSEHERQGEQETKRYQGLEFYLCKTSRMFNEIL